MKKVQVVMMNLVVFTLLLSCWSPLISNQQLIQVHDNEKPQLTLKYPLDHSSFYNAIIIEGFVSDNADSGEIGRVLRVDIEVTGTDLKATVIPDENGAFKTELDGSRLDGTITLVITAIDWNRNQTYKKVSLTKSGFSSFSVQPENKSIRVHWKSDHQISQVDLYYSIGGGIPDRTSSQMVENIDQDYQFKYLDHEQTKPLKNGQVYGIQLAAHTKTGLVFSPLVEAVPLSPFTLVPQVEADYGEIRLFWRDLEGIEKYKVLRFTEEPGNYDYNDATQYTDNPKVVSTNSFTDNEVTPGQGYYYRIQPVIEKSGISGYAHPSGWAYGKASSIAKLGEVLGKAAFDKGVCALAVSGDYLYVAARALGVFIVDMGNVDSLRLMNDTLEDAGDVWNVVVKGSFLAVCTSNRGTHLYDISQPWNPVYLRTFSSSQGQGTYHAAFWGNFIAIAEESRLVIYDLSDPHNQIDHFSLPSGQIIDFLWDNGGLYLLCDDSRLHVLEFNSSGLNLVQSYTNMGNLQKMTKVDSYLYLARDGNGVALYDAGDSENFEFITDFNKSTNKKILDMKVQGELLFLVYEDEGLSILFFDADKDLLDYYGTIDHLDAGVMLEIQGDWGVSLSSDFQLSVFNILNPGMYHLLNTFDRPLVSDVKLRGHTMLMACGDDGIYKYDILQPEHPDELFHYTIDNFSMEKIECFSNWVVLWNSREAKIGSTEFYDQGEAGGAGSIVSFADLELSGARPYGAAFFSDFLYLSFYNDPGNMGVYVYDMSDMFETSFLQYKHLVKTQYQARNLVVSEDILFVSGNQGSVQKARLSDSLNPKLTSGPVCYEARNMSVYRSLLFLSDKDSGIKLFDIQDSAFPQLDEKKQDYYSSTFAQSGFFYNFSRNGFEVYGFDLWDRLTPYMIQSDSVQVLAAEDRLLTLVSNDSRLSLYLMQSY